MSTAGARRTVPAKTLAAVRAPRRVINEQNELRAVMGHFATGVTVLTAGGEQAHGMTANAFTSVSLSPPMVLACVSRAARMHEAIQSAGAFAVSILDGDQIELARYFADWRRPAGMAQFDAVDVRIGALTGSPLLTGALAWIECTLAEVYDGGDHAIFLGNVLGCGRGQGTTALSFYGGTYHRLDSTRPGAGPAKEAS